MQKRIQRKLLICKILVFADWHSNSGRVSAQTHTAMANWVVREQACKGDFPFTPFHHFESCKCIIYSKINNAECRTSCAFQFQFIILLPKFPRSTGTTNSRPGSSRPFLFPPLSQTAPAWCRARLVSAILFVKFSGLLQPCLPLEGSRGFLPREELRGPGSALKSRLASYRRTWAVKIIINNNN
jgi:hypothetical protein